MSGSTLKSDSLSPVSVRDILGVCDSRISRLDRAILTGRLRFEAATGHSRCLALLGLEARSLPDLEE